jgi:hypothetical protein
LGGDQILLTEAKFVAESQLLKLVYVKFMFVQVVSGLRRDLGTAQYGSAAGGDGATKNKRQSAREGEHV